MLLLDLHSLSSLLNPTARFIDHILQPLAQSYPDYVQNSTALCHILQELYIPLGRYGSSYMKEKLH